MFFSSFPFDLKLHFDLLLYYTPKKASCQSLTTFFSQKSTLKRQDILTKQQKM